MLFLRTFSLGFAGILAISAMGCGDGSSGSSGGTGGTGGTGGAGGTTTGAETGGTGGTGGAGGTGGSATGGSTGEGGATAEMKLTSPEITEGGEIPVAYTCEGKNVSPQLDWTAGPPGTLSYALVMADETYKPGGVHFRHWAIYDIPADVHGLPTNVPNMASLVQPPGAKQTHSYKDSLFGYAGPCPSGELHTYSFTVFALDVANLPLVGVVQLASVEEMALEHDLASASLSGSSDAKEP